MLLIPELLNAPSRRTLLQSAIGLEEELSDCKRACHGIDVLQLHLFDRNRQRGTAC